MIQADDVKAQTRYFRIHVTLLLTALLGEFRVTVPYAANKIKVRPKMVGSFGLRKWWDRPAPAVWRDFQMEFFTVSLLLAASSQAENLPSVLQETIGDVHVHIHGHLCPIVWKGFKEPQQAGKQLVFNSWKPSCRDVDSTHNDGVMPVYL